MAEEAKEAEDYGQATRSSGDANRNGTKTVESRDCYIGFDMGDI